MQHGQIQIEPVAPVFLTRSERWLLVGGLFLALSIIALRAVTPVLGIVGSGVLETLWFLKRWILDGILALLAGYTLLRFRRLVRFAFYLTASLFLSIFVIQILSVFVAGTYLTPLAVSNLNHVLLLLTPKVVLAIAALVTAVTASIVFVEKGRSGRDSVSRTFGVVAVLISVSVFLYAANRQAFDSLDSRYGPALNHKKNFVDHESPD
ncbi:MAG: hypothetical protein AAF402_13970 [Pseudomonadota bacterium]